MTCLTRIYTQMTCLKRVNPEFLDFRLFPLVPAHLPNKDSHTNDLPNKDLHTNDLLNKDLHTNDLPTHKIE